MEELVKKAKNNDEEAFDKLITLIEKEMYLIAKTRLKNDDDIADALQETILKCFQNIYKFTILYNMYIKWQIFIRHFSIY